MWSSRIYEKIKLVQLTQLTKPLSFNFSNSTYQLHVSLCCVSYLKPKKSFKLERLKLKRLKLENEGFSTSYFPIGLELSNINFDFQLYFPPENMPLSSYFLSNKNLIYKKVKTVKKFLIKFIVRVLSCSYFFSNVHPATAP